MQINANIMGSVVWWYFRNVKVTRTWFSNALDANGFDGKRFAKPHPMKSALCRSLELLAESRIIKKVSEDNIRLVYQFTAETLVQDVENPFLHYESEAVIHISKQVWGESGDFSKSITKCPDELKGFLVEKFEIAKETFDSNDVTRYVKIILETEADICSIRDGGSVYFVPAEFSGVVERIDKVLRSIPKENGSAKMDYLIIPDIESSRVMISANVIREISAILDEIDNETMNLVNEVTQVWVKHRKKTLENTASRIKLYAEIIGEMATGMTGRCQTLIKNLDTVKVKEQ